MTSDGYERIEFYDTYKSVVNPSYDYIDKLINCGFLIANNNVITSNLRVKLKEFRIFNKGLTENELKYYSGMTLSKRMPHLVAMFKMLDLDFVEEVRGIKNY